MMDNQSKMDSIRANYEAFCGLCDITLLDMLRERVEEIIEEWQSIETRLRNKIASPKVRFFQFDSSWPKVVLFYAYI